MLRPSVVWWWGGGRKTFCLFAAQFRSSFCFCFRLPTSSHFLALQFLKFGLVHRLSAETSVKIIVFNWIWSNHKIKTIYQYAWNILLKVNLKLLSNFTYFIISKWFLDSLDKHRILINGVKKSMMMLKTKKMGKVSGLEKAILWKRPE